MNNKFPRMFLLGFFLVVAVFVSMSFVSAVGDVFAFVVNSPAANSNLTGTYTVNVTVSAASTTNVTVRWWNGTSGAWIILGSNSSNATLNQNLSYPIPVDTTVIGANVSSSIFNITATEANTAVAVNSTNATGLVVDNTAPTIISIGYVNGTLKIPNTNLTINISVADINITRGTVCIVNVNGTNQTLSVTPNAANTVGTCNTTTLSLKGIAEGNQTINIYAGRNTTYWNANLIGVNATQAVFVDGTGPQVELSLASSGKDSLTLNIGLTDTYTATSSCTVDRSGATVSGTTSVSESGLSCANSYTYVVTCTDAAGNTGSATKSFSTLTCGATGGGGASSKPAVSTFSQITPGTASITKYSDATLGVKEISITVDNPAQNVQITVTKYSAKPASVSVSKTGKVYQYLQISTQNLAENLDKANVQFKVPKTWATTNSVTKDKITVYKFDEANSKWNELQTTLASEDDTYYYYDAEVTSFSYFVISERTLVAGEGTTATGEEATGAGGSLLWLWILIIVAIVAVVWLMMRKKQ